MAQSNCQMSVHINFTNKILKTKLTLHKIFSIEQIQRIVLESEKLKHGLSVCHFLSYSHSLILLICQFVYSFFCHSIYFCQTVCQFVYFSQPLFISSHSSLLPDSFPFLFKSHTIVINNKAGRGKYCFELLSVYFFVYSSTPYHSEGRREQ